MNDEDKTREQLITELSELRKTLQETKALYIESRQVMERLCLFENVVETMQIGVTITDLEGNILYVNPADLDMHGYKYEELEGRKAGGFAPAKKRKPLTVEQITSMKRWKRESVNMRKDGSIFSVHLMSDVIKNSKGEFIGVVTTCEDISERKNMENEIKARISELERFYEAAVQRELKMKELKKEIKLLNCELSSLTKESDEEIKY